MIETAHTVHVARSLRRYIVAIGEATRAHHDLYLGASPRASIMLLRASRASAAVEGRDFVTPDDIKALAPAVLSHRVILTADAAMSGNTVSAIISQVLEEVPVPIADRT
jgi:MoxR-like ATPase